MSTDSNRMRLWARLLFLKLATLFLRPAQLFSDIAVSLRGGRGLKSRQRSFLLRGFRLGGGGLRAEPKRTVGCMNAVNANLAIRARLSALCEPGGSASC
jgi:hypothetical protein